MFAAKVLVCITAVLAVGLSAVAPRKPLVVQRPRAEVETGKVDVSPKRTFSSETPASDKSVTMEVRGINETSTGQLYIEISISAPIFNDTVDPPGAPNDPISESDDLEHVQIYFANAEGRILEIRLNRFGQIGTRLLSKPYKEFRKDGLPRPEMAPPDAANGIWSGELRFVAELLPAMMNRINVAVINPNMEGGERYISTYRVYNHPISIIDMQVLTSYQTLRPSELIPDDAEYSQLWEGLQ